MIDFAGFLPDANSDLAGVITAATNILPTNRKTYIGGPSAIDAVAGASALTAQCRGAAVTVNTSGATRTFAGTQTRLYELSGTAWVDVSRGSAYVGTTESRWLFEEFGNIALATNDVEKIQWSNGSGFSDITAGPIARVVFATDNFVMALNTNHTATGDNPDGWMCSAFQDYSSWTASVSTQATNGRLIGGGGFTAGLSLGSYAVGYKENAIFLGSYVGPPVVWQWDRIPGDVGCVGPEAVCDIGGAHVFMGSDANIYLFNGTRPESIAHGAVKEFIASSISATLQYKTTVRHDRRRNLVWVFYISSNGTVLDRALVYNLLTGQWGRCDQSAEAVLQFVSPGVTWDTLGSVGSTWDDLPSIPWDSPLWNAGAYALSIFNTSHQLKMLSGTSTGGGLTTGDFGSDTNYSMLRASRLRFLTEPTSATAQPATKARSGAAMVSGGTSTLSDGKFDHRVSGRFHRIAYTMTGPFEVSGVDLEIVSQGQR